MASGWTNRGKYNALAQRYRGVALPTNFYVALFTSAQTPGDLTNTKADLTELSNGNGYTTGGISLTKNSTDFPVLTEDDTNNRALVQIKDLVWTGSGGNLGPARWACLTDDNATQASRNVDIYWDLGADRTVSDGQALTLSQCEIRVTD